MPKPAKTQAERNQGMNWITKKKRLAIYLRDGLACTYCGRTVEDGARLSLDHLRPYSHGGSNQASNLVTCCGTCNSSRGNRSWGGFAEKVAEYRNVDAAAVKRHVNNCRRRNLDTKASQAIISRRAGWTELVENNYR